MRYHKRSLILFAIIGFSIVLMGCSHMSMNQFKNQASKEVSKATSSIKKGLKKSKNSTTNSSITGKQNIKTYYNETTMGLVSRYNAIGLIDYCHAKGDKVRFGKKVRSELVKLVHKNNNIPIKKSQYYQMGRKGTYIRTGPGVEIKNHISTMKEKMGYKGHRYKKKSSNQLVKKAEVKSSCKDVAIAASKNLINPPDHEKIREIQEK